VLRRRLKEEKGRTEILKFLRLGSVFFVVSIEMSILENSFKYKYSNSTEF
jgi:hypothetical protein